MQRVVLEVMRLCRYPADTAFEAYADLGTGAIDFEHPLPPGRVRFWPAAAPRAGHLLDGHLMLRHLDGVDPDGHLLTLHLMAEHLHPAWAIALESPGYVFGRFQHAVRVFDGVGNASSSPPPTLVATINSAPAVPTRCRRGSYDAPTDRIELVFVPARFGPVAGN